MLYATLISLAYHIKTTYPFIATIITLTSTPPHPALLSLRSPFITRSLCSIQLSFTWVLINTLILVTAPYTNITILSFLSTVSLSSKAIELNTPSFTIHHYHSPPLNNVSMYYLLPPSRPQVHVSIIHTSTSILLSYPEAVYIGTIHKWHLRIQVLCWLFHFPAVL